MKKIVLLAFISVLLSTAMIVGFIRPAVAEGTIYIRADGSIEPSTAPISTVDNITYTFTDSIYDEIVVQRDNIVVDGAGYMLQGTNAYDSKGISLSGRSNVTIKNASINKFYYGLGFSGSSGNRISGNSVTDNYRGIQLWYSSNNSIVGNNITNNNYDGIGLEYSSNNSIVGNNITSNYWRYGGDIQLLGGVELRYSSDYNSIVGNNIIANNKYGIWFWDSSNNVILRNNITSNMHGLALYYSSNNNITENNITNSGDAGVSLYSSSNYNNISGNNITETHIGIELNCSSNNNVSRNTIIDIWDIGIELSSFSSGNSIFENNVSNNDYHGVILRDSSANNLYRNNITDNWLNGISLYHSSNNTIDENNIHNNDIGIYIQNSTNNDICGNGIKDSNSGIVFQSSFNNTVSENRIANNGDGINICNSSFNNITGNNIICHVHQYTYAIRLGGSENTVYGNNITHNFCGIKFENYERVSVPYGYKYVVVCYNNIISGNNITNNEWGIGGGDGMGVYSYNNTFSRNTIANNRNVGISLYHAENNKLWGNIIANNGGAGVGITHGERASNNIFYHNNFMNNTPQVSVYWDPNIWDDGYPSGGNYWSDYNGTDVNNDGIGDAPYVIDEKNIDRYPLMNPWTTSWAPPEQPPPTPAEVQVGVKAGDSIKYDYTVTGWPAGTPYPLWLKVEFLSVEGTSATVRVTMRMSDGTEQNATLPVDVVAGGQAFGLSGFVIPANLTTGDIIFMSGYGNVTIAGETTRTYAGASRTVVYASVSQYGTQLTYYWDKQTGVLVEASGTSDGMTLTAKATETNMWQPAPSFPIDPIMLSVLIAIVIVIVIAVFLVRRKKKPTEAQKPEI